MAKIYRRDNLVSGVTPKKKNEKNRKRSVIVNFRVTSEEKQLIDERIASVSYTHLTLPTNSRV